MPGGINVPLDVILSWPTPNYNDPVTRPKYALIFSCILGPISIALLCARLWVRIRMQRNASWDDWLMLAAAFPMSALAVICPLVIEIYRFDRHAWDVEDKYFPIQRKFVMAIYILYSLASGMIKLSVLLFYRRLSARAVSPAFRWIMRTSIVVIGGYSIAFCVIPIFACRPISAFWDQVDFAKLAQGYKWTCINEGADIVAHGIASTTQDLIVAFLPTMLFWNLQMPRRQKIALYSIFALGYTTVPLGAMRTYRSYQLFFTTYDVTWVGFDIWIWSLLELHIGAMCANAPALKIFFEKVLEVDRLTSWTRSRSRSQSQGSKKQNSRKDSAASAGALRQPEGRHWFKRVVRSSDSDGARGTTLQMDPRVNSGFAASRDSMTKLFASEYTDMMLVHDNRAKYIEMSGSPTSHFEDDIQALPPIQTRASSRQRYGRPPPLSQVHTSWNIDGRRYVWRPWERHARMQEEEHPQWV